MIVSPDHHIYNDQGVYEWTPERAAYAWRLCRTITQEFLEAFESVFILVGPPGCGKSTWIAQNASGDHIYVDATFTDKGSRKTYIKMAQEMGKPIIAVVFQTPLEVCQERNATRSEDRRIPDETIEKMYLRLQNRPVKPTDGFTKIIYV